MLLLGSDHVTNGAANDIEKATRIARAMITQYGMSEKFKNVTLGKSGRGYGGPVEPELVREFSEQTQNYIDEEVARIMDERYEHVLEVLKSHKDLLDYVAKLLLEKESVDGKEFEDIVKAESRMDMLVSEAGKKAEESLYINASAVPKTIQLEDKTSEQTENDKTE